MGYSLLFNSTIKIRQNLGSSHWVSSLMCNPWVSVLQDIKLYQEADTIPEILENFGEDNFIHGWLMFDPLSGFISESKRDSRLKQCHNCYVWLLNMAASYQQHCMRKLL